MNRDDKIEKIEALKAGEKMTYIKVLHNDELIGEVESDQPLTVEADTLAAARTFLKLRGTKIV